jgi:hypothetical protein
LPSEVAATAVEAAGDFTAAGAAEDSAGAEDFPVDMGLAAAEGFAVEAADSPVAALSEVALAGVRSAVAATSDVVTVGIVAGMDADGAGTDSVSV